MPKPSGCAPFALLSALACPNITAYQCTNELKLLVKSLKQYFEPAVSGPLSASVSVCVQVTWGVR